jgi:hypothetical protein
MKTFFAVLFTLLCTTLSENTPTDWDALINDSSQIMTVRVSGTSAERYGMVTIAVYKGYLWEEFTVHGNEVSIELLNHETYLLFADENRREVTLLAPPIPVNEIPAELLDSLNKLPCQIAPEQNPGACYRIGPSVCGCNGVRYGNECEARKRGIVRYVVGDCEKGRK